MIEWGMLLPSTPVPAIPSARMSDAEAMSLALALALVPMPLFQKALENLFFALQQALHTAGFLVDEMAATPFERQQALFKRFGQALPEPTAPFSADAERFTAKLIDRISP